MEVVCIDASNRPSDHPASLWPKEGELYTVVEILTAAPQNVPALVLEEFDLTGCTYTCFIASRFAPIADIIELELTEEITEVN